MSILSAISSRYQGIRSINLLYKGMKLRNQRKCNEAIEKIEELDKKFPIPTDLILLKACLYHDLGGKQDALICLTTAYDQLENSNKFQPDVRKYLMRYTLVHGKLLSDNLGVDWDAPTKIDVNSIDLNKVGRLIKKAFSVP